MGGGGGGGGGRTTRPIPQSVAMAMYGQSADVNSSLSIHLHHESVDDPEAGLAVVITLQEITMPVESQRERQRQVVEALVAGRKKRVESNRIISRLGSKRCLRLLPFSMSLPIPLDIHMYLAIRR